jgi:polar amino acid transport system substrate-binding protein
MKKAWLLVVILMLALGLMLTGCAPTEEEPAVTDDSWDQIVEKGYFVVGLDDAFPPMGFRDENNEIVGFDIDLAKAAAEYLGVEVQFVPVDWSTVELSLTSGDIDCIWNGMSVTEDRLLVIDVSTPYVASTQIVVTLADSGIATKADLAGKKVGTQMASSSIDALAADAATRDSFSELKQYSTFTEAMMDLQNGRVDAVVIDSIAFYGDFNVKAPGTYAVLEENFGEEQMAIGVRKEDDAFTDKLNEALAYLQDSGTGAEISNTWFGEDILIL